MEVRIYIDGQRQDLRQLETIAHRYGKKCQSPLEVEDIKSDRHTTGRPVIHVYLKYRR